MMTETLGSSACIPFPHGLYQRLDGRSPKVYIYRKSELTDSIVRFVYQWFENRCPRTPKTRTI